MPWDHRYRLLDEGETIRSTDECLTDAHLGWRVDGGRCAGKLAPSPLYTSHRVYRRKRFCALCGLIRHWTRVAHAKVIFAKTRFKARRN